MPGNCGLIDHIAGDLVQNGWNTWGAYAQTAFNSVDDYVADMKDAYDSLTPVQTNIELIVDATFGTPFTKPDAPVVPGLAFTMPQAPTNPSINTNISVDQAGEAPDFEATAPVIQMPDLPNPLDAAAPEINVSATEITIPSTPTLNLPTLPSLADIVVPDPTELSIPTFTDAQPSDSDIVAPGETFYWHEDTYTSSSLTELQAQISTGLAGGTGLPDDVWNAIIARSTAAEEERGQRAIQEATEEWASKGWSDVGGVLDKRIREIRQGVQNAISEKNREVFIQQATMEVENLKFYVTQGIAMETVMIGLASQMAGRALEMEKYAFEASINIFNAKITRYNAQLQGWATAAQVYKDRIQAELAKLELDKVRLEGVKIKGELRQQDVQLYVAQLEGVQKVIEVFKAELAGVQAQVEVDKNQIEAAKARVQLYGEQVKNNLAEWSAYGEQVKGQLGRVQVFEAETKAFQSLMQAYEIENKTNVSRAETEVKVEGLKIEKLSEEIKKFQAEIGAESDRIKSGAIIYDAQAKIYSSELGAEQSRVIADDRQYNTALQEASATERLELEEAKLNIEQILRLAALELDSIKSLMGVKAQQASAALAAVSLTASVDEKASNSTSCSTRYNYDMTA